MVTQAPRQFQKQAGAGTTIIRTNKSNRLKRLCVVMRTQQERWRDIARRGKPRNKINKINFSARRVVTECLSRDLPTCQSKLILDVRPGFFDGLRSRRTRAQLNETLNVDKSFLAGKFFPELALG
jgi:hypothetical protein